MNMALNIKNKPNTFLVVCEIRDEIDKPDGTKAFDAKDKAETLNSFFCSIFTTEVMDNIPFTNATFL